MSIIQVVFPIPNIYHFFDYIVPKYMKPIIGGRVYVPLGKKNKIGIVVNFCKNNYISKYSLKNIHNVLDNESLFSPLFWEILNWAAEYYFVPLGVVLFSAIPVLLRQGHSILEVYLSKWVITNKGKKNLIKKHKYSTEQIRTLKILYNQSIYSNSINEFKIRKTTFNSLEKKDLCKLIKNTDNKWYNSFIKYNNKLKLNNDQIFAVNSINNELKKFKTWLLSGITGSGKTEVYLQIIEKILNNGKQVLFLIPEINLTPQTICFFRQRFQIPIDILHSKINNKERLNIWLRTRQGINSIIIGTRSAIFAPFNNLGIIIVDEEHDNSYKQQNNWHYHARNLAVFRAYKENIPIILGSATPALETIHNVNIGKYHRLNLNKKAISKNLVIQQLIDLKGIKPKEYLAPILIKKINKHLQNNNQILFFLNRRGYSSYIICHNCNWVAKCINCNKSYTLHYQYNYQLLCHYCNNQKMIPNQCPKCFSSKIFSFGFGTEQLEQKLNNLFPKVPISRVDSDTTNKKGSLEKHLQEINQGGARILIGTQMLAKGHHFPNLTLVILLNVDGALVSTNFRATENFAQLYIQVSGRTGRSIKKGEVILQTYYPKHPLLKTLLINGYNDFAIKALIERKLAFLPPWTKHAIFKAEDTNNKCASIFLSKLRNILEENEKDQNLLIIGPMHSFHSKLKGYWRWQLLLQHYSRKKLQNILYKLFLVINNLHISNQVKWIIDIDPTEI